MTRTMRAAVLDQYHGPQALRIRRIPEPPHADDKVLIDVAAAGVGFPDLLASYGKHQKTPNLPFSPGLEVSGIVRSAPTGSVLEPGQRVMAFTSGFGGFADTVAVDPANVFPAPARFGPAQAATFILNYHTAYYALRRRTELEAGQTILVLGAAGGLGTAAVQIAHELGARVIAAASTESKRDAALRAGADAAVPTDSDLRKAVSDHTSGHGVDVVFDPVGGTLFTEASRCLAPGGRLLVLGFASGEIPSITVNRLLLRNTSVLGVAWGPSVLEADDRVRFITELTVLTQACAAITPTVTVVDTLDAAATALARIEDRASIGRVVLRCADAGGWFE